MKASTVATDPKNRAPSIQVRVAKRARMCPLLKHVLVPFLFVQDIYKTTVDDIGRRPPANEPVLYYDSSIAGMKWWYDGCVTHSSSRVSGQLRCTHHVAIVGCHKGVDGVVLSEPLASHRYQPA